MSLISAASAESVTSQNLLTLFRRTENLQQFRMALTLVEQRLQSPLGESSREVATSPVTLGPSGQFVATVDTGNVQFRFLPDRRSGGLPVLPYRERRRIRR